MKQGKMLFTADDAEITKKVQEMVAQNTLTLEDLIYQVPTGPNKGKSALWWLAITAEVNAYTNNNAFMRVWNQFKAVIPLEAFLAQAQEGLYKGRSALFHLANLYLKHPEPFRAVWKEFKDKIPPEALLAQPQNEIDKGICLLWLIARWSEESKEFLDVWDQIKLKIPLAALLTQPNGDSPSMLWLLAWSKPEAFIAVWDQFKDKIPLEAILECDACGSTLFLLARKGKLEAFMRVWNKFKESISLEALLTKVQSGPYIGASVLSRLASMPQSEDKESFGLVIFILKNILTQNPKIDLSDLPEVKALINLKIMAAHEFVTEQEIKALFALAKIGQEKGYVDAFYDVGQYFESIGNLPKAFEAYELISPQSSHYQKVCLNCGESRFAESTLQRTESLRNKHLKESLKWALQIQDKKDRLHLIRKISKFYILGPTEQRSEAIISDEQLMLMKDKSEVDFCFAHFDVIKKQIEGEKMIMDLKARLQKEEQMNGHLRDSNTVLLLSFKKLSIDEDTVPSRDRAKPLKM